MGTSPFETICNKILSLDPKIRFVEIAYKDKTYTEMRSDLNNFLTPKETEVSIDDALARWETRKKLASKLGEPAYAMAEYEKVKRITLPIGNDGLLLVSMDSEGFHEIILKEIIDLKEELILNFKS